LTCAAPLARARIFSTIVIPIGHRLLVGEMERSRVARRAVIVITAGFDFY
jgi:hypothetical protein